MLHTSESSFGPSSLLSQTQSQGLLRNLLGDFTAPSELSVPTRAALFQRLCRTLCTAHGFNIELKGELPYARAILVSNHISYIDPIVIGALNSCAPIAKADVRDWPLVGRFAEKYGVHFVNRGDVMQRAGVLRRVRGTLDAGVSVLNFPEGTTSSGGVLPFRRGIFGIAMQEGVPVIPISLRVGNERLRWVGDASFLPHYIRTVVSRPHANCVTVGSPMLPSAFSTATAFAEAARAQISAQLLR